MTKQGGLLGHVTVPRTYKEPGSHKVELAYITKKEAKKLKELDLHNSGIGTEMHYGPMGIPNYNGGGGGGSLGGGSEDDIRAAVKSIRGGPRRGRSSISRRGGEDRDFVSAAKNVSFDPSAAVIGGAPNVSTAPGISKSLVGTSASKPASYVTKPYVNQYAGTTTPPVGTANKPTVTVYAKPDSGPSAYQKALGAVLGTSSSPFNMKQHFSNSEVLEQLAKRGIISGSYADQLKGQDVVAQGLNKSIAQWGAIPFQIAQNTYSQYDPNDPFGSIWGGITSGLGQGLSNIGGILGYNPESNQ